MLLFGLLFASTIYAYEIHAPGDTIVVGEFIYEDDYTPTTDDCTISVYSPAGATLVNEATMSDEANGWHYYSYETPDVEGKYPVIITCGTLIGGDLLKVDKSFILKEPEITDASIASSVWASGTRTLTSFGTLVADTATGVWASGTRTLTAFGSLASDIWNDIYAPTRQLTTSDISGGGSLATESYIDASEATVVTEIETNRTLINALNNISAADVWASGTRTLTGNVTIDTTSVDAIWDSASVGLTESGSIGKLIVDNLDVEISSRGTSNLTAADVWASATRTLSTTGVDAVTASVWANATRTLSDYGNDITAEDVWNVLSSSLVSAGSIGEQLATNIDGSISSLIENWSVKMANVERVQAGYTYRTKIFILNSSANPTTPFAIPEITLYDAERNVVVSEVPATFVSTGVYEYTYSVASGAAQGLWEAVAASEVESGKIIQTNDYFEVAGSPAQVLINSVTTNSLDSIVGNVTITNEGLSGYEYQYEWCVVSDLNNECGGNDAYYASAAKFINPSEDWNTALSASVTTPGTYYFKLVVYFGTDSSGSSRVFTVNEDDEEEPPAGGGGGGGGVPISTVVLVESCNGADFNKDGFVNSIDFSILLYFFKTSSPFNNPCVDINTDNKVDSVDFSIMLFQWGRKPL